MTTNATPQPARLINACDVQVGMIISTWDDATNHSIRRPVTAVRYEDGQFALYYGPSDVHTDVVYYDDTDLVGVYDL